MTSREELIKGYHDISEEYPLNVMLEFIEVANFPEGCECSEYDADDQECNCPTPWQIKRKEQGQIIEERVGKKIPTTFLGPGEPGFGNCWWRFDKDNTSFTHWKEKANAN